MTTTEDNIYTKIMRIRQEFSEAEITKSGHNTFKHFKYLELHDFIPHAIELCNKYNIYTHIDIGLLLDGHTEKDHFAVMTVVNTENLNETLQYRLKLPEITNMEYSKSLGTDVPKDATKQIQDMGKLETYVRRYLYMLFLDIAVPDTVDAGKTNKSLPRNKSTFGQMQKQKQAKREEKEREEKTAYEAQTVEPRHRPRINNNLQVPDPAPHKTIMNKLIKELEKEGKEICKSNLRVKASACLQEKRLINTTKDLKEVVDYINTHCPEES